MVTRLLIPAFALSLSACAPEPETVFLRPDIPPELLEPEPISDREARTVRELAILATEHLTSTQNAKAKIEAIARAVQGPGT